MSDRRAWLARLAPALLLLTLAAATAVGPLDVLRLTSPPGGPADDVDAAFGDVSPGTLVVVGFDPDLGTYAEIRPAVRAVLADLLDRGADLALVSLTPEGRALGLAEADRLRSSGVDAARIVDLGFLPGAEAGLVAVAGAIGRAEPVGLATSVREQLEGPPVTLAVVIGGNDLGPRSWVEQVAPRVEDLEIVAVAPTVLLPELRPYLASGQLRALLATPRDGAAYAETVAGSADGALLEPARPIAPAVAVGLLAAIAWLGWLILQRASGAIRGSGAGEAG